MPVYRPYDTYSPVNKKRLINFLLLAVVLLVGYKFSPMLLPKTEVTLAPSSACDIQHNACAHNLPDGGRLTVSFGGQPVPLLKSFPIHVDLQGVTPSNVAIEFEGTEMNMGLIRVELAPSGGGGYTGNTALPVCVTGSMVWQAKVLVEAGRQRIGVPFLFTTGH